MKPPTDADHSRSSERSSRHVPASRPQPSAAWHAVSDPHCEARDNGLAAPAGVRRVRARQSRLAHPARRAGGLLAVDPELLPDRHLRQHHRGSRPLSASWRSAWRCVIIAGHMDLSVESVAALDRDGDRHPVLLASASASASRCTPEWLVVPVSLRIALGRRRRRSARINGFLVVRLEDERLHRDARLLYLGARPRGRHLRRPLGPGPGAGAALLRHPALRSACRSSPGSPSSASSSSPSSWPRRRSAATSS